MPNVGQELLNVPFPEMVYNLAMAIADSQTKLDMNSTEVAKFLANEKIKLPGIKDDSEKEFPLIALGFFPGYYQFQEAIVEVKMAITMTTSSSFSLSAKAKAGFGCFSASVNASYSRKYEYKVDGSSLLRAKMAPAPPPAGLQAYMEALIAKNSEAINSELEETE